ncbi:hypothetical protein Bbelb_025080 [Branchiostoma belcheri]|nr:hypothetical protein Bbelb_025080 [Branchiostoma belcheri]
MLRRALNVVRENHGRNSGSYRDSTVGRISAIRQRPSPAHKAAQRVGLTVGESRDQTKMADDDVDAAKDAVRFAATFGPLDNLLNGYTLRSFAVEYVFRLD